MLERTLEPRDLTVSDPTSSVRRPGPSTARDIAGRSWGSTYSAMGPVVALVLGCFFGPLLGAAPATAAPPPQIAFEGNVVRGTRIAPGGDVLVVGISHESLPFEARRFTYVEILIDGDQDGAVDYELANPVSSGSVWAVVDLTSGKWAIAAPAGSPMRAKPGRGVIPPGAGGPARSLIDAGEMLDFFVARAGTGAWRITAGDGGGADQGGEDDGLIEVDLAAAAPLGTTAAFDALAAGDVILTFDPRRLEFSAGRVRPGKGGPELADVTGGEGDEGGVS